MKNLFHILVLLAAVLITTAFLGLWRIFIDLVLDDPVRLAGTSSAYPPLGTFAFYWNCMREVAFSFFIPFLYPYGILVATSLMAAAHLVRPHLFACQTSGRLGLILLLLLNAIYCRAFFQGDMTFERFLLAPYPALVLLFIRRLWPHALFVISCWGGCGLIAEGIAGHFDQRVQEPGMLIGMAISILLIHAFLISNLPKAIRPKETSPSERTTIVFQE